MYKVDIIIIIIKLINTPQKSMDVKRMGQLTEITWYYHCDVYILLYTDLKCI